MVDYFKILGIDYHADQKDIRKAFALKIKDLHPDTGFYEEDLFTKVIEAYKILKEPESREKYHIKLLKNKVQKSFERLPKELPQRRIVFPNSLKRMLDQVHILDKKHYRKISKDFKEDLYLLIFPEEEKSGIYFRLNLPLRQICPHCYGNSRSCDLCEGLGMITISYPYEIRLKAPLVLNRVYNILVEGKPFKGAYFLTRKLRIGIYGIPTNNNQ